MWPNNNDGNLFAGNAPFQNGYNQDDFSSSPFGNGAAIPVGGQPIFTQLPFDTSDGEGFQNGHVPDLSMFNNQTAFQQNQFMHHPLTFSPSFIPQNTPQNLPQLQPQPPPTPDSSRRTPQLDAKTAELKERLIKARLMKSRGAQSGSTPPRLNSNTGAIASPIPRAVSIPLRGSPRVPVTAAENREEDLNALISEFSTPKVVENTSTQKAADSTTENIASSAIPTPTRTVPTTAESPAPSVGCPTKLPAAMLNGLINGNAVLSANTKNKSRESSISEGEILEDSPVLMKQPPIQPETSLPLQKPVKKEEQVSQSQPFKPTPARSPMQDGPSSPPRTLPTQPRAQRSYDEHSTRATRDNRRPYEAAYRADRNMYDESDRTSNLRREKPLYESERRPDARPPHSETERDSYRRRSLRDEEPRRSEPEPKVAPNREEPPEKPREELSREQPREGVRDDPREEPQKQPSVQAQATPAQVPTLEVDVRDWLDFTGFHNKEYRIGVLDRRRRLRILDEQRRQILGEIESEEKAKRVQPPGPSFSSMLPPPAPTKPADKMEIDTTGTQMPSNGPVSQESSNKRPRNNMTDSPSGAKVKVARIDDGGMSGSRTKGEDDSERNQPRSSGYGSSRRSSFDHRDYEENIRYDDDRPTRAQNGSRERGYSPRRTGFEFGQGGRSRQYDDENHGDDPSDAFARRGNYDPDFHRSRGPGGGGRGGVYRGRGRGWNDNNKGPGPNSKKVFRGGKFGQ